jgi:hypothetical protein
MSVRGRTFILASLLPSFCATLFATDVLTYHNDNLRTGWNASETFLNPSNVNSATFGKRFSHSVDGFVYAQPLYLSSVAIPGKGVHNVVYVATEHDSVYAFDADDASGANVQPLWFRTFLGSTGGTTITTVPAADTLCDDLVPEIGITATPVIERVSGTLYVEAKTKVTDSSGASYHHHLHALDVATGLEKPGSPVEIQASVPGTGTGSVGGVLTFDPLRQLVRPALLLANGTIYVASASLCDVGPYHGWILGYDAATLTQTHVYGTTPDGGEGGIWMSGGGLAADASGNLFFSTGNGTFDADVGGADMGDSVLRMSSGLGLVDYFTPHDQATLNSTDKDLGSGGVLLLPDQPGLHLHLCVTAGKNATIYLIDRDSMSHFHSDGDHVVQTVNLVGSSFGTPALYGSLLYTAATGLG